MNLTIADGTVRGMRDTVALAWCSGGTVDAPFFSSMMGLLRHDHDHDRRVRCWFDMITGPRITAARNILVANWLADPDGPDWLLMVDTDMTFEADALDRLLTTARQMDAGIAGGLCFVAGPPPKPTLYTLDRNESGIVVNCFHDYPKGGVVVDATGAAFLLIRRDCAQAIFQRYHQTPSGIKDPHPWFKDGHTADGKEMGEDIAFCLRAKNCGFKVVVDTTVQIGHVKPVIVDEHYYDLYRAQVQRGGTGPHGDLNGFFAWARSLRDRVPVLNRAERRAQARREARAS